MPTASFLKLDLAVFRRLPAARKAAAGLAAYRAWRPGASLLEAADALGIPESTARRWASWLAVLDVPSAAGGAVGGATDGAVGGATGGATGGAVGGAAQCSTSYSENRDVRGGDETRGPPPPAPRAATETTTAGGTASPAGGPAGSAEDRTAHGRSRLDALVDAYLAKHVAPEPRLQVLAVVAEDLRLGRYRTADLTLVIETMPAIDAHAWRLRDIVPKMAAGIRRDRLRARLEEIERGRLYSARSRDGTRQAVVDFVDLAGVALYLRERVLVGDRGLVLGERITLTSLETVAAWCFTTEQPTLFPLGDPAPPPGCRPAIEKRSQDGGCAQQENPRS